MNESRKLRVFLCHATQDPAMRDMRTHCRELYQRLKAESWIDPWLDEEKIFYGKN